MKKILIVDDSQLVRESLKENLSDYNVKIVEADSAKKAVKFLKEMIFDLIICDYEMPLGNGMEVFDYFNIHKIRGRFIFFTGLDVDELLSSHEVDIIYEKNFMKLFNLLEEKKFLLPV